MCWNILFICVLYLLCTPFYYFIVLWFQICIRVSSQKYTWSYQLYFWFIKCLPSLTKNRVQQLLLLHFLFSFDYNYSLGMFTKVFLFLNLTFCITSPKIYMVLTNYILVLNIFTVVVILYHQHCWLYNCYTYITQFYLIYLSYLGLSPSWLVSSWQKLCVSTCTPLSCTPTLMKFYFST